MYESEGILLSDVNSLNEDLMVVHEQIMLELFLKVVG